MDVRNDFPLLKRGITYFDNAATSLKPQQVIDAVVDFYENHTANIHRGIHTLSEEATELYEDSKKKVAKFLGAPNWHNVISVKNATEGLNLVASMVELSKGDSVVTSVMEHHSNLLPWYKMKARGVEVKLVGLNKDGTLNMEDFYEKLKGANLVAMSHASNVLGTITPIEEIIKSSQSEGAITVIDAAQSVPHLAVNFKKLDADFLTFSGHKMLAPSGTGSLIIKEGVAEECTPPIAGGGTIEDVTETEVKWASMPERFEGGTPNIEGTIGLGAAADYLMKLGMDNVRKHEVSLLKKAFELSTELPMKIYGPSIENRTGLISFTLGNIHAHDVSEFLNGRRIAVRGGKHCAHPLHYELGVPSTSRASFYIYNTVEEVENLFKVLNEIVGVFS
ncbi:MAG: cysteine desulfurase [Candidatus Altiarchaeota archaeon]|nr:cysteine desulfurase [Candidatus Altiarchaeota archaeon]